MEARCATICIESLSNHIAYVFGELDSCFVAAQPLPEDSRLGRIVALRQELSAPAANQSGVRLIVLAWRQSQVFVRRT